jgi:hypothetical protein
MQKGDQGPDQDVVSRASRSKRTQQQKYRRLAGYSRPASRSTRSPRRLGIKYLSIRLSTGKFRRRRAGGWLVERSRVSFGYAGTRFKKPGNNIVERIHQP